MSYEDKMSGRSGRARQGEANARAQSSQERGENEADPEHEADVAPPPPSTYSLWSGEKTNMVHPS
jgi:hypothetical protein